jgi:hypothetical protein
MDQDDDSPRRMGPSCLDWFGNNQLNYMLIQLKNKTYIKTYDLLASETGTRDSSSCSFNFSFNSNNFRNFVSEILCFDMFLN